MSTQNLNIDEFGRDLSLKKSNQPQPDLKEIYDYIDFVASFSRYKGKSWAEIEWMIEDEEEEEEQRKEQEKFQKELEKRRLLLSMNQYELEEGEVLE